MDAAVDDVLQNVMSILQEVQIIVCEVMWAVIVYALVRANCRKLQVK